MTTVASILILAAGCDKRVEDTANEPAQTTLAGKPRTLLLLFGDRGDPRILPLATLADGRVSPIALDASGWRNFDNLYFTSGAPISLYRNGAPAGEASVRRGMWQDGKDPLYKLPRCRSLKPLAAVTLAKAPGNEVMLEMLATTDPLADPPQRAAITPADLDSARAFANRGGQREGLTVSARNELDLVVNALQTGATSHPTLVGSYLERGNGTTGKPRHVFLMADWSDSTHAYVQSFVHVPGDSAREFRRLIDHVDLTGDGVDEVVLEGWQNGGDSYLVFLKFQDGHWREIARTATSWCVDPGKKS